MRIHKVNIDSELDRFGGRALIVQTNRGTFKTPNRVVTSSEFQYKAKLPFEPPINNDISEIVSQFNRTNWESFMKTNGSFASRLRRIEFYADKMGYTIKKFYPQIPSTVTLDDSAIKLLLELQRMSNLDFITLPNLPSPVSDLEKLYSDFTEEVLSERREPLIYLDMGLEVDEFRERFLSLLELSKTDQVHSIGLIYRPIHNFVQNYKLLWDNRDSPVFLQMSSISREYTKIGTSTMHLLQKWGIDAFSGRVGGMGFSKNGDNKPPPREDVLMRTKRLDPQPLVVRRFRTWVEHSEDLNCGCPVCQEKSTEDFMATYDTKIEKYPGEVFNAANRLHDYYRSVGEFNEARKYIRSGELSDYFKEKDGLRKSDVRVPPKTGTINDYI